jgi:PII-like signaling protein
MKGIFLKFYTYELQKHHGMLLYEWLLEFAKKNDIHGGSAFRAIAGFGRHGVMHEEHFFELASDVPVEVNFVISKEEMNRFLNLLSKEEIDLFYTQSEVEYGSIKNGDYTKYHK